MNSLTEYVAAIDELAVFAAGLSYPDLPLPVRERLSLMLVDLLGVTAAGARTPEVTKLASAWQAEPGDAPLIGAAAGTRPETAAYLNAVAACCLELDEGNKHAQGHPAVHVLFAAIAATQLAQQPVSGEQFLTAVAAGYEVAARFGRALDRNRAWHPHGNWGATGAACAAALILGATQEQVAAAIDASTGLMHVTPWSVVLEGNFVRNFWAAGANLAGLNAARLATAGLARNSGTAAHSLGEIVGSLEAQALAGDLGRTWLIGQGYGKRHASCSYTHAAVDLIQGLKEQHEFAPDDVAAVLVRTHSLAEPLFARNPHNRLSAMFSFPFVVSAALLNDRFEPAVLEPGTAGFAAANNFSERITMEISPDFDRRLPAERWAEVRIDLRDGTSLSRAQPNPLGDVDYFPLGTTEIAAKLSELIGRPDTEYIQATVAQLPHSADAKATLATLRTI